jgi:hypothetical protein
MSRSLENIFDRLCNADLDLLDPQVSGVTVTGGAWPGVLGVGNSTASNWNGATGITTGNGPQWTVPAGTSAGLLGRPGSSKIILPGPDADIQIGDISLVDLLKTIQQRMNILQPNTKLEAQWSQLRELGDQYRALEAQLLEQNDMWNKLKAMPPPVID